MTVREFARHLGVSDRMVSKWERDTTIDPRPVNQAALDTSLARADDGARARFRALVGPAGVEQRGASVLVTLVLTAEQAAGLRQALAGVQQSPDGEGGQR